MAGRLLSVSSSLTDLLAAVSYIAAGDSAGIDSECNNPDSIEDSLNGHESDSGDEFFQTVATRSKRKRGKRSQWAYEDLDDFVDIIVNDENHQRKLIFQNTE